MSWPPGGRAAGGAAAAAGPYPRGCVHAGEADAGAGAGGWRWAASYGYCGMLNNSRQVQPKLACFTSAPLVGGVRWGQAGGLTREPDARVAAGVVCQPPRTCTIGRSACWRRRLPTKRRPAWWRAWPSRWAQPGFGCSANPLAKHCLLRRPARLAVLALSPFRFAPLLPQCAVFYRECSTLLAASPLNQVSGGEGTACLLLGQMQWAWVHAPTWACDGHGSPTWEHALLADPVVAVTRRDKLLPLATTPRVF